MALLRLCPPYEACARWMHVRVPATRFAWVMHQFRPPKNQRAQGKPGVLCTRSLACNERKHTSKFTTGTPKRSGLPCAMVLTLIFVLSPVSMTL